MLLSMHGLSNLLWMDEVSAPNFIQQQQKNKGPTFIAFVEI